MLAALLLCRAITATYASGGVLPAPCELLAHVCMLEPPAVKRAACLFVPTIGCLLCERVPTMAASLLCERVPTMAASLLCERGHLIERGPFHPTLPSVPPHYMMIFNSSCGQALRKVRWQMRHLRLIRAPSDPRARVRRLQLRLLPRALRHLRGARSLGCLLLSGVHAVREGCASGGRRSEAPGSLGARSLARITYLSTSLSPKLQRDGCPKIINLGASRQDRHYQAKK